jgi:ubiquitin C-terminal hydrolase
MQHCGHLDSKFNHHIAPITPARGWHYFNNELVTKATKASLEAMESYVLVYVAEQPTAHF